MRAHSHLLARMRPTLVGVALCGLSALVPFAAQAGTATYKYDNLGRLSEINYGTGVAMKYVYDAAGTRSSELVAGTGVLSPEAKAALIALIVQLLLDD